MVCQNDSYMPEKENLRGIESQWLKDKLKEIKETYNLPTINWIDSPIPESFTRVIESRPPTAGGLWELYGKGKLCQQDPNARSGLRSLANLREKE